MANGKLQKVFALGFCLACILGSGAFGGLTQGGEDPDPDVQAKRNFVKQMMKDAWDDYERYAWGQNQLKPISQVGETGGIFGESQIGATIIDALSTLHIMELEAEYEKGSQWIKDNLDFPNLDATVSVFETNIRIMGGLLSAYAFTGDEHLLNHAYALGKLLMPAFETPTGIPRPQINIMSGVATGDTVVLADFGTLHLEFNYLTQVTNDPIFVEKVDRIRTLVKTMARPDGFYSNFVSVETGDFIGNDVSIGVFADSFYEYFIKAAIMLQDGEARELYDGAMDAFVRNGLVKASVQNHLLYIAEMHNDVVDDLVWHFACFAGGMFALGAASDPASPNSPRDFEIGKNFTNTCHESYTRSVTGLGPEIFKFSDELEAVAGDDWASGYYLRPEVIESYFYLWRLTGESKYRDWAWEAAQAIERHCKVGPGSGYSGITNVYAADSPKNDVQETFFFAETLKYLYLIFSTNELIDLEEWVFNTEAHPLPIKGTWKL